MGLRGRHWAGQRAEIRGVWSVAAGQTGRRGHTYRRVRGLGAGTRGDPWSGPDGPCPPGSAPARRATPSASGITTRWCRRSSRRSSGSSRSSCTQSTAWTAATATSPWSGCEGTGSAPAWAAASCRRACRSRARGRGGRPPPATSRAGATQVKGGPGGTAARRPLAGVWGARTPRVQRL